MTRTTARPKRKAKPAPTRPTVAVPFCPLSPTSEHAWTMSGGERVCAHCGGAAPRVKP